MAFDDLLSDELTSERRHIFAGAVEAAQLAAARRLTAELGHIVDAPQLVEILVTHDTDNSRYDLLKAFEKRWALLVLRLLAGTLLHPAVAVSDARERGATVPENAEALGLTTQGVYATYRDQVVGRGQRSRAT